MSEQDGLQEVNIDGDAAAPLLVDQSGPNETSSVPPPKHSRTSRMGGVLRVFLILSLRVALKFWKVCITEILLIVLVFWLYGGMLVFLLMITSLVAIVYSMQDFLLFFPDNPKMSTVFVPSAAILDLPYENLVIKTLDHHKISGVLLKQPPDRTSRSPTILFLHGNAGNLGHRLFNAKLLYTVCHCNVLLLDYRGYGKSEGSPCEQGLYTDAQSTLDYLHTRRDIDPSRIFLFGRSLGGSVAIHIAAEKMNAGRFRGLIVENTFTSIQDMGSHLFMAEIKWIPMCLVKNKFLSFRKVGNIHSPTLFLSGSADELVPPKMMKDLFMRCKAPKKTMYCFTGGTHNETWHCDNYFPVIKDFMWKPQLTQQTEAYSSTQAPMSSSVVFNA